MNAERQCEAVRERLLHVVLLSWRFEVASGKKTNSDLLFGRTALLAGMDEVARRREGVGKRSPFSIQT